ncbi:hypothetical protein GCM10009416_00280 [Craurococcus roseus]|uniref:Small-conductance mechanosensitive channel n=1 Tax=Craurococcus roseus TaxID=77585 RepID=A0ABN1EGQ8_9PROT
MGFDTALARLNGLGAAALALLPGLLLGLLAFGLFVLLARGLRAGVVRAARARGVAPGVGIVLGRIGSGFCLLLGGLVAAAIAFPSINAADLFSVLGIGGVAIGFAFRDILQNALAGILILLTRPFRIGDQVVAGGYEGTVEDIQVRATTIRTYDNRRAVIPNTALFTDKVLVNTAFEKRRLSVRVGVGNGDDIREAKRVIEAAARGAEGVLADPPPRALVAGLGDSAVLLDVFFWIDPPKRSEVLEVTDRVLARVKPALSGAGIDIPYPTMQVLLHDQTEAIDGDRARQREGWPARGGDRDPPPRWRVREGEEDRPSHPNGAAGRAS